MKIALSSFQWAIFILAGSIVTPLAVGDAFSLNHIEMIELLQRMFLVIGISSFLQGVIGHKLPILEGPAGLWWGVFLIFSNLATASVTKQTILQNIELGLILSGLLFIFLSVCKVIGFIKSFFTPIVIGVYMILLVSQLSGSILKGILGIGYLSENANMVVAGLCLITILFMYFLTKSRINVLRNYSVLVGLLFGWILFYLFGQQKPTEFQTNNLFDLPELFAWGTPQFDLGITVASLLTSVLLLTNLVASVDLVGKVTESSIKKSDYNRSGLIMGVNHIIASMFSAIGCVPNSHSAGFIMTTNIRSRIPFIFGSILLIVISLFPKVAAFLAMIPSPVAYAAIIIPFSHLLMVGLKEVSKELDNEKNQVVIGLSLMVGIGCMFISPELLGDLPPILVPIVTNGLIMGSAVSITLEQLLKRKGKMPTQKNSRVEM